ncbi:VOC family protein [Xylanimonas sp. McL0601]|uniref:VOC family protein n=1 Tax=Xylanimonas sp. McL0601 TaxID=3414739 RepID=UPI003CE7CCBF
MLQISDVTYLVRDIDEAIAFFVDALGFEIRSDEDTGPGRRRVVVGPDGGGPGLVLKPGTASDVVGRQAGGGVAFFLRTDDFAAVHARLAAHGVTFREEPRHEPYGTVVVFEDLYGQPWDLIEPPAE